MVLSMKICLITDTHFGCHSDSPEFLTYQKKFFDEQFFPYLKEHNITEIIDLGDTFDSRKSLNYNTLHKSKEMFFDIIENEGYHLRIIVGNHSTFYKEHNEVNSPNLLFSSYKNIEIIEEPTTIRYGSLKFLLIPWINVNNESEIIEAIDKTDAKYLLGHFEITNIILHQGWEFHKGLQHSLLDKFQEVWSGHYHLKLKKDNFLYLGTPYDIDWSDINHNKGFYIFNTDNKKLTFIKNNNKIYHIVEYTDAIDIDTFDYSVYKESYIRVILNDSISGYTKFDLFVKRLEEFCYDLKVDEKFYESIKVASSDTVLEDDIGDKEDESTLDTIRKRCNEIDIVDKKKLFKFMEKAFLSAKELLNAY
jgi:DNA repair exonuclease SbcCD nuclease subunit